MYTEYLKYVETQFSTFTCTCEAISFGEAQESALSRLDAREVSRCSRPSSAEASSTSSISRPKMPERFGERGPQPGGSS